MNENNQERIKWLRKNCSENARQIHVYKQVLETTVNRLAKRAEEAASEDELVYLNSAISDLKNRLDALLFDS